LHLFFRNRRWAVFGSADKARDLARVFHEVPGIVVHDHFNEHVTREQTPLGRLALTVFYLDHLFGGHKDTAEFILHAGARDTFTNIALDRLFHARISMDDIPLHTRSGRRQVVRGLNRFRSIRHDFLQPNTRSYKTHSSVLSVTHKNKAMITTKANT